MCNLHKRYYNYNVDEGKDNRTDYWPNDGSNDNLQTLLSLRISVIGRWFPNDDSTVRAVMLIVMEGIHNTRDEAAAASENPEVMMIINQY